VNPWIAVFAAAAAIVAFFVRGNRQTAKAHARFTPRDVEIALAEVLDPQARNHDAWDSFLAWPLNDPYLESIRQECQRIFQECPGGPGKDISDDGEMRVAALLAELRRRVHTSGGGTDA
jgi:hypothetical protein